MIKIPYLPPRFDYIIICQIIVMSDSILFTLYVRYRQDRRRWFGKLIPFFKLVFFLWFLKTRSISSWIVQQPYICEACYFFLEYAITAMFCWMFIEGIYLHSVVATNILKDFIGYRQYLVIGWCTPMVFSATWAWATSIHYSPSPVEQ